ncbi:unnamed protein product [Amoebophrya sp. A120]|nr:unnamed protein product [Amoebophrya sp. A120]|eukprot:GSA120T00024070001.1
MDVGFGAPFPPPRRRRHENWVFVRLFCLSGLFLVDVQTTDAFLLLKNARGKSFRGQEKQEPAAAAAASTAAAGSTGSAGSVGSMGSFGSAVGSVGSLGSLGSVGSMGSIGSMGSVGSWGSFSAPGSFSEPFPELGPTPPISYDKALAVYEQSLSGAGAGSGSAAGSAVASPDDVCAQLGEKATKDFPDAGVSCTEYRAFIGGFAEGLSEKVSPNGCRCVTKTGACPYETCTGIDAFNTCLGDTAKTLGLASFSKLTISAPALTTSCIYLKAQPIHLNAPGCDAVPGSKPCGVPQMSGSAVGSAGAMKGAV